MTLFWCYFFILVRYIDIDVDICRLRFFMFAKDNGDLPFVLSFSLQKLTMASNFVAFICKKMVFPTLYPFSTPPAKKTELSNLVLRAQDHKKNPKFKGWQ